MTFHFSQRKCDTNGHLIWHDMRTTALKPQHSTVKCHLASHQFKRLTSDRSDCLELCGSWADQLKSAADHGTWRMPILPMRGLHEIFWWIHVNSTNMSNPKHLSVARSDWADPPSSPPTATQATSIASQSFEPMRSQVPGHFTVLVELSYKSCLLTFMLAIFALITSEPPFSPLRYYSSVLPLTRSDARMQVVPFFLWDKRMLFVEY